MPLGARTVEPIYLGRRPLREGEEGEDVVQVALTQNALLGTLVQLASLVRHADDVFCDLADECQRVFEHTERIIRNVKRIKEKVGRLDSKAVTIPVGDLKQFSAVQDHHEAKHGFDCAFFTPDLRPHCIKFRYSVCEVTPVGALRGADPYRKDGLRSSDLFKLWPVVLKDHEVKSPELSKNRRQGRVMTFNKKYKRLKPRSRTLPNGDSVSLFHQSQTADTASLSSSDMSKSQPSILVAVDTSGTGFNKMSTYRRSLRGTVSLDRKTSRRRSSGISENVMQDIEVFERGRRSTRTMPRNYSFDDLESRREPEKDEVMMQYFDEMDAKMEEKAEQEQAIRDVKLLKFLPCRRSRSLPRTVKMKESHSQGGLTFEGDSSKEKPLTTASNGYASSLSLGSAGGSSNSSKSTRRSSIIGSKFKSFVNSTLRPRPKSLDFDTVLDNDADDDESTHSNANLTRKVSPSMPDNISSLASSRESKVGPGSYYYFTSNTLPRAQARKYDFPWESLPKDWTTSVKLRAISKRRREERNSSSGNWSGSSNRQSLDSERSSTLPSASHLSLGRDSGRDSMGEDLRDDSQQDKKSTGDSALSSFMPLHTANSPNNSTSDTEQWLASLALRAAAREDATAAGDDVTESLTRLSELTKQNIQALEDTFSPAKHDLLRLDDEVSSIYSLDQDGFYTSFHTDSGLKRSTGTLIDEDEDDDAFVAPKDVEGMENSGDDAVFQQPMEKMTPGTGEIIPNTTNNSERIPSTTNSSGKIRPPPPVRSGSRLSSKDSVSDSENKGQTIRTDQPLPTDLDHPGSPTDSDQETVYARLKVKTKISSQAIPSWCPISDEDSPDSSHTCLAPDDFPHNPSGEPSARTVKPYTHEPKSLLEDSWNFDEMGEDSWNWDCLPQRYLESKVWEEDLSEQSNSWPRGRRSQPSPGGILKRDKSPADSLKPKTLNFAPVVNMYDHQTQQGVELPLNAASSCSSSSSSETSTAGLAFTLSHPPPSSHSRLSRSLGDMKNMSPLQQDRLPTCGSANATSTPLSKLSQVRGQTHMSSDSSVCSSESPLPSESSTGHSGYLGHSSQDTLSSSSSAGLSDIDSSLTFVSRSGSNSSTPTNSTLVLNSDAPTPVNTPPRDRSANMSGLGKNCVKNGDDLLRVEPEKNCVKDSEDLSGVGPGSLMPSGSAQLMGPPVSGGGAPYQGAGNKHYLSSFSADASTEAAPVSWTGDQGHVMVSSSDSGFSSPSSQPVCIVEQPCNPQNHHHSQQHHHHHNQHHHHHNYHHPHQRALPTGRRSSQHNTGLPPSHGNQFNLENSDSRYRQDQTVDSHPNLSRQTKHEQDASASNHDPSRFSYQAPRSDSYRAATDDLIPLIPQVQSTNESSQHRYQSLAQQPRSNKHESTQSKYHSLSTEHESTHSKYQSLSTERDSKHRSASHQSRNSKQISAHPKHHRSHSSTQVTAPRPQSLQTSLHTSISCPSGVLADPDGVIRADSYRLAVRNTHGVVGDIASRNVSYRMATGDDDPLQDSRMDAINSWDRKQATGNRDVRRLGITDIDQLKTYDSDSSASRASSSSRSGKSPSRGFAGIHSHKKMIPEVENLLRGDKTPSPELRRLSRSTSKSGKEKDKEKDKRRSSTYIRFDPIFEQGDGMYSSTDTLRAESVEMITSEEGLLMSDKVVGRLPPGSVRGGGRRNVDDRATLSIFDSIKTTIKSISSKHSAEKDMWKYDTSS